VLDNWRETAKRWQRRKGTLKCS